MAKKHKRDSVSSGKKGPREVSNEADVVAQVSNVEGRTEHMEEPPVRVDNQGGRNVEILEEVEDMVAGVAP